MRCVFCNTATGGQAPVVGFCNTPTGGLKVRLKRVKMPGYTVGFMKLGFEWSEIDTAPFFSGILTNLSFPQVSSSYDIGKWWGQP